MKKSHYFFFSLIIATIAYTQFDLSQRLDQIKISKMAKKASPQNVELKSEIKKNEVAEVTIESPEAFVKRFKSEADQIGKTQAKPELVQMRLQKLAQQMDSKQIAQLFELISDDKANADQRALAVELLSIKNNAASLSALQNFVANSKNINGVKWDQKKELETVLRAQAVESIAAYPEKEIALSTLSFLQEKVDQRFLNERISRASLGLMTGAKPSQLQDEEALKKLVE